MNYCAPTDRTVAEIYRYARKFFGTPSRGVFGKKGEFPGGVKNEGGRGGIAPRSNRILEVGD